VRDEADVAWVIQVADWIIIKSPVVHEMTREVSHPEVWQPAVYFLLGFVNVARATDKNNENQRLVFSFQLDVVITEN